MFSIVNKVYAQAPDVFGEIKAPQGVAAYDAHAPAGSIGIIAFVSTLLRTATVVAGVFILFNFIMAGFSMVTGGGKSEAYSNATQKMTMSIIGIIVMVASYIIVGIISLIVFGDPKYILEPTICGPTGGC
jgi:hypothetical protein